MKNKVYGYARISTTKQNIERQERNIKKHDDSAIIVKEVFTGTKLQDRKELEKILKAVKIGDTIIFDSVSRMSRNASEGFTLYKDLFQKGINLIFLKEQHINTSVFKKATETRIQLTGQKEDVILQAINEYMLLVAEEQIKIAFDQAQKEIDDLHQRTKEGIQTAKLNGKQIGAVKGKQLNVKKKNGCIEQIRKHSKDFNGTLTDNEVMTLTGLARNTYYKYKREMKSL